MSYTYKIKTLEESYRVVESQIETIEKSDNIDKEKLAKLYETKNRCLMQLRELRKLQYEEDQRVDLSDDR